MALMKESSPPRWVRWVSRLVLVAPRFSPLRWLRWPLQWAARKRGAWRWEVAGPAGDQIEALVVPGASETESSVTVLMTHGYLEIKELHLARAWRLAEAGHTVILFDLPSHGASGGKGTSFGVREVDDLVALVDAAVERKLVGSTVASLGYSTGAAVALQHAAIDDRVAGVVAMAPFADLATAAETFRQHLAEGLASAEALREAMTEAAARAGFDIEAASAVRASEQLDCPVLVIAGTEDRHLPPADHAVPIVEAAGGQLIEVEGANHLTLCTRPRPEVDEAILKFLADLPPADARPDESVVDPAAGESR
ncbi:MAG: alpha/beta fold hydrolase [Phycisphaeraceae bacterium]|nr:alpha/beta fold hydrolase [Phycisphaeraceae bacterium]